jgi:hypothetical protein
VRPLTKVCKIDHKTGLAAGAEADGVVGLGDEMTLLVGNLPHLGCRHEDYHDLFAWDSGSLRGLRHKGVTVSTDRQDPLVEHGHQLSKVVWVLLDLGSMRCPLKVFDHPLLRFGHLVQLHGAISTVTCIGTTRFYQEAEQKDEPPPTVKKSS